MVISWLLHSIDRDIAESVIYCETTEKIWLWDEYVNTIVAIDVYALALHKYCRISKLSQAGLNIGDKTFTDEQFNKLVGMLNNASITNSSTEAGTFSALMADIGRGAAIYERGKGFL
ncbi:hypothetical protein LIER_38848 [Lithospermum erythrorhizon]|uniref:Uncharacterized protein n=1 Tax=Lithospermum erythrorhizon TaxID=34254 RepID=A0AAV3Q5X6_LITER